MTPYEVELHSAILIILCLLVEDICTFDGQFKPINLLELVGEKLQLYLCPYTYSSVITETK